MFNCSFCEFSSARFRPYLKHARVNHESTGGFSVLCPEEACQAQFTVVRSLTKHIQSKHRGFAKEHLQPLVNIEGSLSESVLADQVDDDIPGVIDAEDGDVDMLEMPPTKIADSTDVFQSVAKTLLACRETYKLPAHVTTIIARETQNLICSAQEESAEKVLKILRDSGVKQETIQQVTNACAQESKVSAACSRFSTPNKLERYVAKHLPYVPPQEKLLGRTITGTKETVQIVSIEASLRNLFSYDDVFADVLKGHQTNSSVLRDVVDGSAFREHPLFSTQPNALALIFYMDEFTVTNPLRGRAKNHKIMACYFTLANQKPETRSQLKVIQLAMLCLSKHIKKYGLDVVMQDVTDELKRLAEHGIDIIKEGQTYHFPCELLLAVGDNLGVHQMGGFMEGFTATRSCRFCMVSLTDLRDGQLGTPRTSAGHNEHVRMVTNDPTLAPTYGVKKASVFADVGHFNAIGYFPSDIAHDIFEGVFVTIGTLVLQHCIKEAYFDHDLLNKRVLGHKYVGTDKVDKPCRLGGGPAKVAIKQTFSQSWCLLRMLPLIVGDLVPDGDPAWDVLLKLLPIVEFVCAPEIHRGHVDHLTDLMQDLLDARKTVFPEVHLKPKDHFLLHYPEQCLRFGPLVNLWTFRFEAKHNYFLEVFKPSKNHMNVCSTLAKRHQHLQCVYRDEENLFELKKSLTFPSKKPVNQLPAELLTLLTLVEDVDKLETVLLAKSITIGSTQYTSRMVVATGLDGDLYHFHAIQQILVTDTKQYLVCNSVQTQDYNRHLNAYVIEIENTLELVDIEGLKYKTPLGIYSVPGGDQVVVLKFKMLF